MFGVSFLHTPGQELKEFDILVAEKMTTEKGRVITNVHEKRDSFKGILSQSRQEERERWHQSGHPITHTITRQGITGYNAVAGNIISHSGRKFYIQAVHNPAGLNHFTLYYCEERPDTAQR